MKTKAYLQCTIIIFIIKNKMIQKYFCEIVKIYLYNFNKIFNDNLVVD